MLVYLTEVILIVFFFSVLVPLFHRAVIKQVGNFLQYYLFFGEANDKERMVWMQSSIIAVEEFSDVVRYKRLCLEKFLLSSTIRLDIALPSLDDLIFFIDDFLIQLVMSLK